MEPTSNALWFDALLRHQIYALRMSGGVRNDVIAILNATEKDIEGRIRTVLAGDRTMSPTRLRKAQRLVKQLKALRNKAWDKATAELTSAMKEFTGKEALFLKSTLEAIVPVELIANLPSAATLRALVTDLPFEGRVLASWARTMRASDLRRIQDQIQIGIVQGESSASIARRVVGTRAMAGRDGALQTTRRHVQAVTRTATIHYSNAARTEFLGANRDLFTKELFVATLDGRTTPVCRGYDGQRFPIAEGPQPPLHFQCRSLRVAAISQEAIGNRPARPVTEKMLLREYAQKQGLAPVRSYKDLPYGTKTKYNAFASRRLREMTGQLPAKVNYNDWLRTQSTEFQNDVLGVARGKLFRKGDFTLQRFVNRAGDEIPLAQLAARDAAAFKAAGLDPSAF